MSSSIDHSGDGAHELLSVLGFDQWDAQTAGVVSDGVESGFPPCCIAFFVLIWSRAVLLPKQYLDEAVTGHYRRLLDKARDKGRLEDGYVPCPACLLQMLE